MVHAAQSLDDSATVDLMMAAEGTASALFLGPPMRSGGVGNDRSTR